MQFDFSYELSQQDKKDFLDYYSLLVQKSIEQHPDWPQIENADVKYSYLIARNRDKIACTAVIVENKSTFFPTAQLQFGPLSDNSDDLLSTLRALIAHFRRQNCISFTIQLGIPTGNNADFIEYQLNKDFKILSYYDRNNWSSLQLDLRKPEEEIFRNFSKGHKSDIKKAIKNNIQVNDVYTDGDWEELLEIFSKMNARRGLDKENKTFLSLLKNVRYFFEFQNEGSVLMVRDVSGRVIGGILLAYQGTAVRYFKGASDPDQRHLPVLHLAIWEGIKMAKSKGYQYFDFWGYNHFVTENDQVFHINRFKKGFGGTYSFYPKKMYIIYKPLKYKCYALLKRIATIFNKG